MLSRGVSWDEGNSFELLVAGSFSSCGLLMFWSAANISRGRDRTAGKPSRSNVPGFAIRACPVIVSLSLYTLA